MNGAAMGKLSAHSVAEPSVGARRLAGAIVVAYALAMMIPLARILLTGFKTPPDSISCPPKVVFEPSLEDYVNLFTSRSRQPPEYTASLPPPETWYDRLVRSRNMIITGPSRFADRYVNSVIIGFSSTFLAVFLGTLTAYAFSRFRVPLQDDLLFFILSTRMMPPHRGRHPDLPDVPRADVRGVARPARAPARDDPVRDPRTSSKPCRSPMANSWCFSVRPGPARPPPCA